MYGNMVSVPCLKIDLKAIVSIIKYIVKPKRIRHPTVHHKDRLYTCLLIWNLVCYKFDHGSRVSAHNEKITAIGDKVTGASPA